jgi:hypothetical protein
LYTLKSNQYSNYKNVVIDGVNILTIANQRATDKEGESNAQYTALAVNNLNQLAEALERLDFLLEGDCRPMYLHARGIIKEALNKIS